MRSVIVLVCIFFAQTINFAQFKNVQINNPRFDYFYINNVNEVTISIDPNNPNNIAAGSNLSLYCFSEDAGLTWSNYVMESLFNVWGDPVVIYDNNSNLYYGHLSNPSNGNGYFIDRIIVQKSTDNGVNWDGGKAIGYNNPKQQDKEWLAVDRTNSQFRNNLYLSWTEFDDYGSEEPEDKSRILCSYSNDEGITWSRPVVVSDVEGNCIDSDETTEGAVPAIGPNGEVYVSWAGPLGLVFDKSLDGGKTFGTDVFVAEQIGGWDFNVPGINRCNGLPITACDISDSQYRGNIYINWSDQSNGEDNTDIFLIKSVDGGKTWSNVKRVNDDNSNRHQFFTWMTIDQTNGNLYFVFYDRRNTTEAYTDVYIARSTDGGETFENFKINEKTFLPSEYLFFGDYSCIDAYNGSIHPIWTVMDDEVLSIWTATIKDSELITDVQDNVNLLSDFKLFQNYPNPFNPSTTIGFSLSNSEFVSLNLYNSLGQFVKTIYQGNTSVGLHEVTFDASIENEQLPSGIYYYRLTAGNFTKSKKMILLK